MPIASPPERLANQVRGKRSKPHAHLRHFPFLSFLHGAFAGLDHSHHEYVGVVARGTFGRTVGRTVGTTRGIGRTIGAVRGTTTTVFASAGNARKSTRTASRFILNLLLRNPFQVHLESMSKCSVGVPTPRFVHTCGAASTRGARAGTFASLLPGHARPCLMAPRAQPLSSCGGMHGPARLPQDHRRGRRGGQRSVSLDGSGDRSGPERAGNLVR